MCDDLDLCYWAGKKFTVDVSNLATLIWARPDLEGLLVGQIRACSYALIELGPDWQNDYGSLFDSTFTEKIVAAIENHYAEVRRTETAIYLKPRNCGTQFAGAAQGRTVVVDRRPASKSR
ncbi:MAG: hypothetical protein WBF58_20265 [Xanthobacteraceae bacterium]